MVYGSLGSVYPIGPTRELAKPQELSWVARSVATSSAPEPGTVTEPDAGKKVHPGEQPMLENAKNEPLMS